MKPASPDFEDRDLLGDRMGASTDIGVCLGLGDLATELGKTRDVLRRILSEAGVAATSGLPGRPLYRLREVLAVVFGERDPAHWSPYERKALALALLAEDDLRVRKGELLDALDVEQTFNAFSKKVMLKIATAVDVVERDVGISPAQAVRLQGHFDEMSEQLYKDLTDEKDRTEGPLRDDEVGDRGNIDDNRSGPKRAGGVRKKAVRKSRSKSKNSGC